MTSTQQCEGCHYRRLECDWDGVGSCSVCKGNKLACSPRILYYESTGISQRAMATGPYAPSPITSYSSPLLPLEAFLYPTSEQIFSSTASPQTTSSSRCPSQNPLLSAKNQTIHLAPSEPIRWLEELEHELGGEIDKCLFCTDKATHTTGGGYYCERHARDPWGEASWGTDEAISLLDDLAAETQTARKRRRLQ